MTSLLGRSTRETDQCVNTERFDSFGIVYGGRCIAGVGALRVTDGTMRRGDSTGMGTSSSALVPSGLCGHDARMRYTLHPCARRLTTVSLQYARVWALD